MSSRNRTPVYIFFLDPVYNAAFSLRSLRSNEYQNIKNRAPGGLESPTFRLTAEHVKENSVEGVCTMFTEQI